MYATIPLDIVLGEATKAGATEIDIWTRPHADHRDRLNEMGAGAFATLLAKHGVSLGVLTNYPLGPFRIAEDISLAQKLGGKAVLCGTTQPSEPKGEAAKTAVRNFLEEMKPHVERAEDAGVMILLENHDRQLLYTPDSLRYFAEYNRSPHLKLAYAIHHQQTADANLIAPLIRELGDAQIGFIYFQEQGKGIREKLPKDDEMMQMPGFGGGVDYRPIMAALKAIRYRGWIEIFMHPTPRGIPILATAEEITAAINRSRAYVEDRKSVV